MKQPVRSFSYLQDNTLRLKRPFGQSLGLSFLLFLLLICITELFVRTEFARSHLAAPHIGSQHRQFEIQLARLDTIVAQEGAVDCIFLGNSLVWLDINPPVFSEAYKSKTGENIHCFNFGVSAMPAVSAGALAKILVEDYHPKLLIYGLHAGDLVIPRDHEDASVILNTPWVKYRTEQFTMKGWLYAHLYTYRYSQHFQRLLKFDFQVLENDLGTRDYQLYGFDPKMNVHLDVNELPDLKDPSNQRGVEKYYNYQIKKENLEGLMQLVNQNDKSVQVIVLGMPVHRTFYYFFENGEQDYLRYIDQVEESLKSVEVPFWQTTNLHLTPDEGWWDYSHMNLAGANIFSEWLGHRVGQAVIQGELNNLTP